MRDILFVKTSSLGDVIHNLPALADARRHLPDAQFSWVVEDGFAPLLSLVPGVEAIPVSARRWRRAWFYHGIRNEVRGFVARLRARRFDRVIDTQGLMKSAWIVRLARGERHGYDRRSIREPLASIAYDVRYAVPKTIHAIARNRELTGLALGYVPDGPVDYGLDRAALAVPAARRYAVLLHATARSEKLWPEAHWIALAEELAARGLALILPWGEQTERARAQRLAAAMPDASVPDRMPLDRVARLIAGAELVVGVDTGLLHLAAALGIPLAAIFTASEPGLTGPMGAGPIAVLGGRGVVPSVAEVSAAVDGLLPRA
jgi:heptosyltransferase-1